MTNEEWLESLAHNDIPALRAWFKAEHVDTANVDELKGQVFTLKVECDDLTSACDDLENELYKAKAERDKWKSCWEKCKAQSDAILAEREQYRKLFGMALDWAHEITMLESSIDEGMA